jgi:hypothetical protein
MTLRISAVNHHLSLSLLRSPGVDIMGSYHSKHARKESPVLAKHKDTKEVSELPKASRRSRGCGIIRSPQRTGPPARHRGQREEHRAQGVSYFTVHTYGYMPTANVVANATRPWSLVHALGGGELPPARVLQYHIRHLPDSRRHGGADARFSSHVGQRLTDGRGRTRLEGWADLSDSLRRSHFPDMGSVKRAGDCSE